MVVAVGVEVGDGVNVAVGVGGTVGVSVGGTEVAVGAGVAAAVQPMSTRPNRVMVSNDRSRWRFTVRSFRINEVEKQRPRQ